LEFGRIRIINTIIDVGLRPNGLDFRANFNYKKNIDHEIGIALGSDIQIYTMMVLLLLFILLLLLLLFLRI
jgi:hypothetical protein